MRYFNYLLLMAILNLVAFAQSEQIEKNGKSPELEEFNLQIEYKLLDKFVCDVKRQYVNSRLIYKNVGKIDIIIRKNPYLVGQRKINRIGNNGDIEILSSFYSDFFYQLPSDEDIIRPRVDVKRKYIRIAPGEGYEIENIGHSLPMISKPGNFNILENFVASSPDANTRTDIEAEWGKQNLVLGWSFTAAPLEFTIEESDLKSDGKCAVFQQLPKVGCKIAVDGKKICETLK